jgi:hypothetical protein
VESIAWCVAVGTDDALGPPQPTVIRPPACQLLLLGGNGPTHSKPYSPAIEDGELLAQFTINPTKDYQPQKRPGQRA